MLRDRYGNEVSTGSQDAVEAYVEGVDLFLGAQAGADVAYERAIAADGNFALAHAGLARARQMLNQPGKARDAMARARDLSDDIPPREQGHVVVLGHLIDGNGGAAYAGILEHIKDYPRDVMVVQPCAGVFGLIGFSGKAGREAELLAFHRNLSPHYGDDWWFGCQHAFAQAECGQLTEAQKTIAPAFAANTANANGAHIYTHVQYECGDAAEGFSHLTDWRKDYNNGGFMHCHISWHEAIWALEAGDSDRAWQVIDKDVRPGATWGPPINVMTDTAAFLLRAEFAGEQRRDDRWREVSQYASDYFAKPGVSFADAHAALAHAMAGDDEALAKLSEDPAGPAGDMVKALTGVYGAFAAAKWQNVVEEITPLMSSHERLGGSRAQRDLLELTLVNALLKLNRGEEAARMLAMRRPRQNGSNLVAGIGG